MAKSIRQHIAWWIELLIPIVIVVWICFSLERFFTMIMTFVVFIYVANSSHPFYYTLTMIYDLLTKNAMPKKETYFRVKKFEDRK